MRQKEKHAWKRQTGQSEHLNRQMQSQSTVAAIQCGCVTNQSQQPQKQAYYAPNATCLHVDHSIKENVFGEIFTETSCPSHSDDVNPLEFVVSQMGVYLSKLLHIYTPSRQLRSSTDIRVFRIPSFRTTSCGQRSFSYQAPVIWNQLPVSVRHSTSVSSFKSSLKTFLFLKTFSSVSLS